MNPLLKRILVCGLTFAFGVFFSLKNDGTSSKLRVYSIKGSVRKYTLNVDTRIIYTEANDSSNKIGVYNSTGTVYSEPIFLPEAVAKLCDLPKKERERDMENTLIQNSLHEFYFVFLADDCKIKGNMTLLEQLRNACNDNVCLSSEKIVVERPIHAHWVIQFYYYLEDTLPIDVYTLFQLSCLVCFVHFIVYTFPINTWFKKKEKPKPKPNKYTNKLVSKKKLLTRQHRTFRAGVR